MSDVTATADEASLAEVGEEMCRMRTADTVSWADYVAEGREWDEATVDAIA